MSTLPGELVDSIIDFASFDPQTLAACGLVAKQWLPCSRFHLFSSIHLRRNRDRETVKSFLLLVQSPLATFLSCVLEVHLHHHPTYEVPILSTGDLLALLTRTGLRPQSLFLYCKIQGDRLTIPPGTPQGFLASLTHLGLNFLDKVLFDTLVDYVCGFPLLESLSLGDISIVLRRPKSTALPPNLHTLDVSEPSILDWLLTLDPIPQKISTLILRGIGNHRINQYLRNGATARAVQSLTIDQLTIGVYKERLDMMHLRRLRHICLLQHKTRMASYLIELAALRGSLAFQMLETIKLTLYHFDYSESMAMDKWREADAALAGPEITPWLPRLSSVVISGRLGFSNMALGISATVASELRQNMPFCQQRGILAVI
ncbi:hypothetical protein C8J57DRAFT_1721143 [Mycena rebaudengoi]|nr:hypothetical protein C8J57DRAFT_1721143 [Mycena rebaudengoi]